jgi:hypothetical protein
LTPATHLFSEHAKKGGAPATGSAAEKLGDITKEKMTTKNMSFNAAFSEAQAENPELAAQGLIETRGE